MSTSHVNMIKYSILSTVICCALVLISNIVYKKGKKILIQDVLFACLIIIVSSLRYGVGSDYFRYLEGAKNWSYMFSSDIMGLFSYDNMMKYHFEVGYKFLSVIGYYISKSPYTIFWLVSMIIYIPIVVYCRKHTTNAHIAITTYILFGYWALSLNAIGQSVSMVIMLYVENAIENKKYIRALLLVICAETFHTTAIAAAIILIIIRYSPIKKMFEPKMRNVCLLTAIGIVLRSTTAILINIVSRIPMFSHYTRYIRIDASEKIRRLLMMIGAGIETIIIITVLILAIFRISRMGSESHEHKRYIKNIMAGIPFSIVGISRTDWLWLSNRFAEYFFVFLIVLIPLLLDNNEYPDKKMGIILVQKKHLPICIAFVLWHVAFSILMFNNNWFTIDTYIHHL